ncbi:MAG: hypothetical protein ACLTDM_11280 [Clostridium butyricum]
MKTTTITLKGKQSLKDNRQWLKENGFTEIKLIYRAGQYVLTYVDEVVDPLILMATGIIKDKRTKEQKEKMKSMITWL